MYGYKKCVFKNAINPTRNAINPTRTTSNSIAYSIMTHTLLPNIVLSWCMQDNTTRTPGHSLPMMLWWTVATTLTTGLLIIGRQLPSGFNISTAFSIIQSKVHVDNAYTSQFCDNSNTSEKKMWSLVRACRPYAAILQLHNSEYMCEVSWTIFSLNTHKMKHSLYILYFRGIEWL